MIKTENDKLNPDVLNALRILNDIDEKRKQRKIVMENKLTIYYVNELKRVSFYNGNEILFENVENRYKKLFEILTEFRLKPNIISEIYENVLKNDIN